LLTPAEAAANAVFRSHPAQLLDFLERVWRQTAATAPVTSPYFPGEQAQPGQLDLTPATPQTLPPTPLPVPLLGSAAFSRLAGQRFRHLIYAYMIENSRAFEVFRRIVFEFLHGERLGVPPDDDVQSWLRNTEALFFRNTESGLIWSITSDIRADFGATRRNAYQRMFDMELNHGGADNQPYPYQRAEMANREFVATFEEFLAQVWVAVQNNNNLIGANPTDRQALADLASRLHNMLINRRRASGFSRVEFVSVATMSWFHLTLEYDSPLVRALQCTAEGPAQRLTKLAQRVGLAAASKAESYIRMADPIERLLVLLEDVRFSEGQAQSNVGVLFAPGPNQIRLDIETVLTQWSIGTGRDLKSAQLRTSRPMMNAPAISPPPPTPATVPHTNGAVPVA
jgi:hypothetical protein